MTFATQLLGLVVAAVLSAGSLNAQAPSHEFGMDLGVSSTRHDGTDGRVLRIATPVDLRVGFVTSRPLMLETRLRLGYTRTDDAWGLALAPGINLLWRLGQGTGLAGQMGPYLTGGATFEYGRSRSPVSAGTQSSSQFGLNVGVGTRLGWGTAAFRPELFFQQDFRSRDPGERGHVPGSSAIGLRFGISLWS